MSNLSDKELDRLSREAADSYEPESSSLSWTRLEQKLIEQMPERPPDVFRFGQVKPWVWAPAVALVAGISFYFIKNNFYSKHSTRTNEPVSQIKTMPADNSGRSDKSLVYTDSISSTGDDGAGKGNTAFPEKLNTKPDAGTGQTNAVVPGVKSGVEPANAGGIAAVPGDKAMTPANSRTVQAANGQTALASGEVTASSGGEPSVASSGAGGINTSSTKKTKKSTSAIPVTGATATVTTGLQSGSASNNPDDLQMTGLSVTGKNNPGLSNNDALQRERNKLSLPQPVYVDVIPGQVKGNDSLLNQLARSKTPVPVKSMHINRSLNIGLALGPDYTDAGGITNNQLSNNIGLTVGYYLTNKISVNTGIFYSNKFYWSNGHKDVRQAYSQNTYPTTTFAYAPPIEYVNGSCNMYELPLSLRYDFAKNEKTKFFVNAGASSYFMLKQTYIYFFHSGGRGLAFKSTDEAQVNYWFGMGDLSFGLETEMGKGFSFQAEPFFRIPLKQMGVENLKLYSYGLLISFRYAPVLSRTKK